MTYENPQNSPNSRPTPPGVGSPTSPHLGVPIQEALNAVPIYRELQGALSIQVETFRPVPGFQPDRPAEMNPDELLPDVVGILKLSDNLPDQAPFASILRRGDAYSILKFDIENSKQVEIPVDSDQPVIVDLGAAGVVSFTRNLNRDLFTIQRGILGEEGVQLVSHSKSNPSGIQIGL